MEFKSILNTDPGKQTFNNEMPDFFTDLNLDQVIHAITYGKEEYDLESYFYSPVPDKNEILYRQEIMKDLENPQLFSFLVAFAERMQKMRFEITESAQSAYPYEKERLFLDAVEIYCTAIDTLYNNLSQVKLTAQGLISFREYLEIYKQSAEFLSLLGETKSLLNELNSIKYCIRTKELTVEVRYFNAEAEYSREVEHTFEKFKEEKSKDYRIKFSPTRGMNHVEAAILEGVAKLFPEIFERLHSFYSRFSDFRDEIITTFDRQVQFYISYLHHIAPLKEAGLQFCYPEISTSQKDVFNYDGFDIALANKLTKEKIKTVCNDFYLKGKERIFIVSGPNQGGKTTFSRTFGQLHYIASLGCPVPGREAKLFLFDRIFTHFEKEEKIQNLRSKLEDDLFRIHTILQNATPNSIIIMNEILSSTTLQDAVFLSTKIMEKITSLDCLCVWVTFIDELLSLSDKTVSMVSAIVPENPAMRTFKIERKPADGVAYAISIAEKYKVTYPSLRKRIQS
jgi:DNA mismatch repair ATPase MutS